VELFLPNEQEPVQWKVYMGKSLVLRVNVEVGKNEEIRNEEKGPCCKWSNWGEWEKSHVTCGPTKEMRSRVCSEGGKQGAKSCSSKECGAGENKEMKDVDRGECPTTTTTWVPKITTATTTTTTTTTTEMSWNRRK